MVVQFGALVIAIPRCEASEPFFLFAAGKLLGGLKPQQTPPTNDAPAAVLEPQVGPDGRILPTQPRPVENAILAWPLGSKLSIHVYLSTDPAGNVFGNKELLPYFIWNDITFGDWNEARVIDLDVNFSQACLHSAGVIVVLRGDRF